MKEYNWVGKTILAAEDIPINFKLLELILKKTNVNLIWVQNGEEAIKYVKTNEVHLVLMDIQMPVMDGYDATKAIKLFKPKLPIIAQTAFTMTNEKENSLKAGCDAYISKPINKNELLALIAKFFSE
jgi:CheY-like chemotaxis protein